MGLGSRERVDDVDRGGEEDRVAAQAGCVTKGDGEVAFSEADVGDEDHVGMVLNELQAEEVLNLWPVDLLGPAPVELIQCLEHREAGEADTPLDAPIFTLLGLTLDQPGDILDVRPMLGGGCLRQRFIVFKQIGQLEVAQMRA